jgi:hypothetical protein
MLSLLGGPREVTELTKDTATYGYSFFGGRYKKLQEVTLLQFGGHFFYKIDHLYLFALHFFTK